MVWNFPGFGKNQLPFEKGFEKGFSKGLLKGKKGLDVDDQPLATMETEEGKGKGKPILAWALKPGEPSGSDHPEGSESEAPDWDEEEHKMEVQHGKFCEVERDARLRNGPMTPKEEDDMKKKKNDGETKYNKVMLNFGLPGGSKSAKELLHDLFVVQHGRRPGQFCSTYTPEFSLCKHLFLAGINWEKNKPIQGRAVCYCFPDTSLMPVGCIHNKRPLVSLTHWSQSLCPTCSLCARCDKLLGFPERDAVIRFQNMKIPEL